MHSRLLPVLSRLRFVAAVRTPRLRCASIMAAPGPATLFERIASGELPSRKVYEDDACVAFHDVAPVAPVHVLVVPRSAAGGRLASLSSAAASDAPALGHLLWVAAEVARRLGVAEGGYRIVINDGAHGCQTVPHLHLHVIGGKQLSWPPGSGAPEGSKAQG